VYKTAYEYGNIFALFGERNTWGTVNPLTGIIHQPLGASPRFMQSSHKPHAGALRLIYAVFWARQLQAVVHVHLLTNADRFMNNAG
jgi:hypothetical protein